MPPVNNTEKFGLDPAIVEKISAVLRRHPEVERVRIYGSRALGTCKNGSDIDLALDGADVTGRLIDRIGAELDELMLPYTFDLTAVDKLRNAELIEHIERVGVELRD